LDTWIEFHATLARHKKTTRLMRLLGIGRAQAAGHLAFLWSWAIIAVPDGDVSECTDTEIAGAALWEGDANAFCNALRNGMDGISPWIDANGMLHDWYDYTGKLLQYREKLKVQNRQRQATYRKTHSANALRNTLCNDTPTDRPIDSKDSPLPPNGGEVRVKRPSIMHDHDDPESHPPAGPSEWQRTEIRNTLRKEGASNAHIDVAFQEMDKVLACGERVFSALKFCRSEVQKAIRSDPTPPEPAFEVTDAASVRLPVGML
jgi:hypothetical protein